VIPDLKKVRTTNDEIRQLQDGIMRVVEVLRKKEILDGRLIKDVILDSAAPTEINHGLGRALNGWIVTRISAAATVHESESPSTNILTLEASADVTVSLWVF
jgi:hypothetical protein